FAHTQRLHRERICSPARKPNDSTVRVTITAKQGDPRLDGYDYYSTRACVLATSATDTTTKRVRDKPTSVKMVLAMAATDMTTGA
ncbi:hypothetical protein L917_00583, partial [Phytophthora nicotianae]